MTKVHHKDFRPPLGPIWQAYNTPRKSLVPLGDHDIWLQEWPVNELVRQVSGKKKIMSHLSDDYR